MRIRCQKGFSLIEALVVLGIMATLGALVTPYLSGWRENAQFKEGARDLASAFQETRSVAIARNLQARLVVDVSGKTFRIEVGNLPNNSSWPGSVLREASLSNGPSLMGTNACNISTAQSIIFNPNGTSDQTGTFCVCVMDGTAPKYRVGIQAATSGRVVIKKSPDAF